jgi:cytochrome c biogenesis protein CcmG/thiol:disulfide interchange protein DsbE
MADEIAPATPQERKASPRRPGLLVLLPLAVFLLLAGIFLKQLLEGGATSAIPSALIGEPAPAIVLPPLEGLKNEGAQVPGFDPAAFAGKPVIVNVWASWCAPCRLEHPLLTTLAERGDVALAGINYKDDAENALRFLGQLGNPFDAVGVDPAGKAAIEWGVYGVPETFIVGADGRIAHKLIGPLTPENLQSTFLPALEKAVAEAAK